MKGSQGPYPSSKTFEGFFFTRRDALGDPRKIISWNIIFGTKHWFHKRR